MQKEIFIEVVDVGLGVFLVFHYLGLIINGGVVLKKVRDFK